MILTFTGSTTGTFSVAANWSPAFLPTLGDICIFTSSSPTCSLISIGTCSQVDFSSYNKRISFGTNNLVVYGDIKLGTGMSFTFSTAAGYNGYNLVMASTGSLTSNGMTMSVPFGLYNPVGSNNTYTLQDNLVCAENFSTGAAAGTLTHTINGFTISCYKNVGINIGSLSSATLTTGTTNIIMLGTTPTLTSGAASVNGLTNNFIINTSGNVTVSGTIYYKTGTFKLLTGKLLTSNLTLTGNGTLDFSGSNSGNVQNTTLACNVTGNTITLLSDMHILGFSVTTIASTSINGADIYAYGTSPISVQGSSTVTGTTTVRISGTSSASTATIGNSGNIGINLSIQTPGTLNWNQVQWYAQSGGNSLVYTSGTILYNGSSFQIGNSSNQHTFYTSGMNFNNVSVTTGGPVNINLQQQLNATTLTVVSANTYMVFTGSAGFNVNTFTPAIYNTARLGLGLQAGITYSINTAFNYTPAAYSTTIYAIKSNTIGSQAKFVLGLTATQNLHSIVTDDIDSSAGQTIWCFNYDNFTASTNTLNWRRLQATNMSGASGYIN
jgi:hypothetical protein